MVRLGRSFKLCTFTPTSIGILAMKKFLGPFVALALLAAVGLGLMSNEAQAAGGRPAAGGKTGKQDETYMVIQVGEEFRAIRTSSLKDEEKKVADDYKDAMKAWRDAKKSDPKAPRPAKLIVVKKKSNFETEEGAKKYIDTLQDDADKKGGKGKTDKKQ